MDPLSALGLAGNIVQFLDFTWNLITETKRIVTSVDGVSYENRVLETIMNDMQELTKSIAPSPNSSPQLKKLAAECAAISSDILSALASLKAKGHHTHWDSFLLALKQSWRKGKVEKLASRLGRAHSQLSSHMQAIMMSDVSDLKRAIENLNQTSERFGIETREKLVLLGNQLVNVTESRESERSSVEMQKYLEALHDAEEAQAKAAQGISDQLNRLVTSFSMRGDSDEAMVHQDFLCTMQEYVTMLRHPPAQGDIGFEIKRYIEDYSKSIQDDSEASAPEFATATADEPQPGQSPLAGTTNPSPLDSSLSTSLKAKTPAEGDTPRVEEGEKHTDTTRIPVSGENRSRSSGGLQRSAEHGAPGISRAEAIRKMTETAETLASSLLGDRHFRLAESVTSRLGKFRSSILWLERASRTMAQCQAFLKRLHFPSIKSRQRNIEAAHSTTFEWILQEPKTDTPSDATTAETSKSAGRHHFVEWLRNQNRPFWVQGKAGSGKSTLMKFVADHPKTKGYLRDWAGSKGVIVASFYFWNAGTPLQRSQEGLLRALLFEIFRICPELIPSVATLHLEEAFEDADDSFSLQELLDIYAKILKQPDIRTKFCFFIDGLDEFQESKRDHRDLIQTLRQLDCSSDIKICVSSRPWIVFEDAYGNEPEWFLKLEDLTKGDIHQVVRERFNAHPQFRLLIEDEPAYEGLIQQVVDRSQGVFLWVYLVVRDLLEGLTYNDSIKNLQSRLESFPADLEDFFQHMIDAIPKVYLPRASRMFRIATSAERPIYLMFFSLLEDMEDDESMTIEQPLYGMPAGEIDRRRRRVRRRLDGRSRGLLEIVEDECSPSTFVRYKVDFLHRTVRDFLCDSRSPFLRWDNPPNNADIEILSCKAALAMMRRMPIGMSRPQETWDGLFELFFSFCNKAAQYPGTLDALRQLLENAEMAFSYMCKVRSTGIPPRRFLAYACQHNALFYVQWKLESMWHPARILNQPDCPMLHYALSRSVSPSSKTVDLLLSYGANPNQVYRGSTVWSRFLAILGDSGTAAADSGDLFSVVKSLLLKGANPHELAYQTLKRDSRPPTASELIRLCFPAEQATILLACRLGWVDATKDYVLRSIGY